MPSPTASLQLTHAACDAALQSIAIVLDDTQHTELDVLRTDFISLLSLIYAATTKLALALKPSSPTHTATLTPLKDLANHVTALSHCVRLFGQTHGSTFNQEITLAAKDVIVAVKALIRTFLDIEATPSPASTGMAGDEYMVRTGAVHEVITNIRSSLSKDNVAAVQKKLAQDHASLDDGFQEVDGMVNDQGSMDDASESDWEDDGWGELGIDSKVRMTSDELERTKKVHAILRLSTLLHKRIIKDILTIPSGQITLSSQVVENLDSLPPQSSSLVVASDELVATLYTPQNPSDISTELAAFAMVINSLQSIVQNLIHEPSLADQIQAISLQTPSTPQKDPKKWFQTCFAQIQKAIDSLSFILNTEE
ncbi:hypothetical protein H0H87_000022 [Tephrocybe sp. NHM501043]|nr:hypothetical protein H0H87_000022 [Tephrocybe sp. NHM501043]